MICCLDYAGNKTGECCIILAYIRQFIHSKYAPCCNLCVGYPTPTQSLHKYSLAQGLTSNIACTRFDEIINRIERDKKKNSSLQKSWDVILTGWPNIQRSSKNKGATWWAASHEYDMVWLIPIWEYGSVFNRYLQQREIAISVVNGSCCE